MKKIELEEGVEEEVEELIKDSLLPFDIAVQALIKIGLAKVRKTPSAFARALNISPIRKRKKKKKRKRKKKKKKKGDDF